MGDVRGRSSRARRSRLAVLLRRHHRWARSLADTYRGNAGERPRLSHRWRCDQGRSGSHAGTSGSSGWAACSWFWLPEDARRRDSDARKLVAVRARVDRSIRAFWGTETAARLHRRPVRSYGSWGYAESAQGLRLSAKSGQRGCGLRASNSGGSRSTGLWQRPDRRGNDRADDLLRGRPARRRI